MSTSPLLHLFKPVALIFATSSVFTGVQALANPIAFSQLFGIHVPRDKDTPLLRSYITLVATRQLATGITLLLLARKGQWVPVAYVLVVMGIIVAGIDGVLIARNGSWKMGIVHAGPGFAIAAMAAATIYTEG